MKRLIKFVVLTLFTVFLTAVAAPQAHALECSSKVVEKQDTWVWDDAYWSPPDSFHDFNYWNSIRLTANALYIYCPAANGGVKKLKIYGFDFCWTILENKSYAFDGVTFAPTMHDDDTNITPPSKKVGDDGTMQNCASTALTATYTKWLTMPKSPYWTVTAFVNMVNWPDTEIRFKSNGNYHRYFQPSNDPNISAYYWL